MCHVLIWGMFKQGWDCIGTGMWSGDRLAYKSSIRAAVFFTTDADCGMHLHKSNDKFGFSKCHTQLTIKCPGIKQQRVSDGRAGLEVVNSFPISTSLTQRGIFGSRRGKKSMVPPLPPATTVSAPTPPSATSRRTTPAFLGQQSAALHSMGSQSSLSSSAIDDAVRTGFDRLTRCWS